MSVGVTIVLSAIVDGVRSVSINYDPNLLRWALRSARMAANMTQNAAKEALDGFGVKRAYNFVWRIESGKELDEPKFVDVALLAAIYNKSLDELAAEAGLPTTRRPFATDKGSGEVMQLDARLAALLRVLTETKDDAWRERVISAILLLAGSGPEDHDQPRILSCCHLRRSAHVAGPIARLLLFFYVSSSV